MATSGSIDFGLNVRQLCTYALEELSEVGAGQTPDADDMAKVRTRLNLMLKSWQVSGPNLWRQTEGTVTVVASTASYVLTPRPFRVIEARYRDTGGRDLPMCELTRQEYLDLALKTSTGIPTQYYVDYQRAAATMYVWPVPASVTTETVKYTYQRSPEDVVTLDEDLDIPQEYLETVGTALAVRCMPLFGKDAKDNQLLMARNAQLMAELEQADREAMIRFVPDRSRR